MTTDKARKRNTRERARAGGDSYAHAHRTDPWRDDSAEYDSAGRLLPRADLERYLTEAESLFKSNDPYQQQRAYANASHLYVELARHTADPTWAMAARMASQMYGVLAAQVRWEHRIPTILPKTEAARLHLGSCDHCGRPWQGNLDGACEWCPRLLFGPTPDSREHAAQLPAGDPVELAELLQAPHDPDDY